MYSYQGLEKLLKIKGLTKTDLSKVIGIFSRTIAKISKVERISLKVLNKIASFLSCDVNGLYREISENIILQTLRDEKEFKISGGLYHELQIRMTFNSNHIEGSELDEEQTRMIFETRAIGNSDVISIDDIIETSNHFRCIDVAEKPLTEEIIKHIHFLNKERKIPSLDGSMSETIKKE